MLQKMSRMIGLSPWKVWKDGQEPLHAGPPPLTPVVAEAQGLSSGTVVADNFGIKLMSQDLARLQGTRWLNDQIVDFYMEVRVYVYYLV